MTYQTLTSQADVEILITGSAPVWLFKHSNACPVSFAALDQFEAHLATHPLAAGVVVIQEQRPLSNWLAVRLGFVHQSPQLFLMVGGKVAWQASHWGITDAAMQKAVGEKAPH